MRAAVSCRKCFQSGMEQDILLLPRLESAISSILGDITKVEKVMEKIRLQCKRGWAILWAALVNQNGDIGRQILPVTSICFVDCGGYFYITTKRGRVRGGSFGRNFCLAMVIN